MGLKSSKIYVSQLNRPQCVYNNCNSISYPEYALCLTHIKETLKKNSQEEEKTGEKEKKDTK